MGKKTALLLIVIMVLAVYFLFFFQKNEIKINKVVLIDNITVQDLRDYESYKHNFGITESDISAFNQANPDFKIFEIVMEIKNCSFGRKLFNVHFKYNPEQGSTVVVGNKLDVCTVNYVDIAPRETRRITVQGLVDTSGDNDQEVFEKLSEVQILSLTGYSPNDHPVSDPINICISE